MTEWKLYLRDRELNRVAEINDYLEFHATLALNDAGKWSLSIHGDASYAQYVNVDLGTGIILTADNEVVMSGPAEALEYVEDENGAIVSIQGIDDTGLLAYRNAWPSAFPPWTSEAVDHFEGGAEEAMRYYVNQNACATERGGAAFYGHAIPYLYLSSDYSNLGAEVNLSTRFDNLLATLQSIGVQSGLRFQIQQHPTILQHLEFIVTAPQDKSAHVRFSKELGNIASVTTAHGRPAANFIVVAGQGQGIEREFATILDLPSAQQYGFREYYYDLRQQITLEEMGAKASEKLASLGDSWSFDVETLDGGPFAFRRDWDIGDRVTVQWAHQTAIAYIAGADIALTPDGAVVNPSISTLFKATRDDDSFIEAFRRIGHLEQTAEMMTPDQIVEIGNAVFSPIEHDATHDDEIVSVGTALWAPIEHDTFHDDAFAPIQHDNANHSTDFAPTPHDSTHHTVAYLPAGYSPTAVGTYTGDGTSAAGGRSITCGFVPRLVVILTGTSTGTLEQFTSVSTTFGSRLDNSGNITYTTAMHIDPSDGFRVGDGAASGANTNTKSYNWVAFR